MVADRKMTSHKLDDFGLGKLRKICASRAAMKMLSSLRQVPQK